MPVIAVLIDKVRMIFVCCPLLVSFGWVVGCPSSLLWVFDQFSFSLSSSVLYLSMHDQFPSIWCYDLWRHFYHFCNANLHFSQDGGIYKGVKLVSGQELFSPQLILAPSFATPCTLPPVQVEKSHDLSLSDAIDRVARGICVTKKSVNKEVANCLVFFPPRCEEIKFSYA